MSRTMTFTALLVLLALVSAPSALAAISAPSSSSLRRESIRPTISRVPPPPGTIAVEADELYPAQVRVAFSAKGQNYDLSLTKNTKMFSENYKQIRVQVDADGAERSRAESDMNPKHNCYYHGHVDGQELNSDVAVDLCSGLSGMVRTQDNTVLNLQPAPRTQLQSQDSSSKSFTALSLSDISGAEHFVTDGIEELKALEAAGDAPTCGNHDKADDAHQDESAEKKQDTEEATTNKYKSVLRSLSTAAKDAAESSNERIEGLVPRYLELLVFNDVARYKAFGAAQVEAETAAIINLMHKYYRRGGFNYDVHIILKGQITFIEYDPWPKYNAGGNTIKVDGYYGLLSRFNAYRSQYQSKFPRHDIAALYSGESFESSIRGLAGVGTVCDPVQGSNICQLTYSSRVVNSVIATHELAHNLGSHHDGSGNVCGNTNYIMQPAVSTATYFSPCSIQYANRYFGGTTCMNTRDDSITDADAKQENNNSDPAEVEAKNKNFDPEAFLSDAPTLHAIQLEAENKKEWSFLGLSYEVTLALFIFFIAAILGLLAFVASTAASAYRLKQELEKNTQQEAIEMQKSSGATTQGAGENIASSL